MTVLPASDTAARANLFGCDREALDRALAPFSVRPYQAKQIFHHLYGRLATDFSVMSDLPSGLRSDLSARFRLAWTRVKETRLSSDGSRKYLLTLDDGREVESVYIVYGRRVTLCLSSQVGCPLACRFCLTGTMGLVRNLEPGEILGQIATMAQAEGLRPGGFRVVLMGMGEPLANYDAVMQAFRVMIDPQGFALSPRRVTLSTAGLIPGIDRLAKEPTRPRLAISLGATQDEQRDDLMPINRKHDLAALVAACRRFPLGPREKITFEYCLIEGQNDRDEDARRLARLTHGLRAKVNVIPYNDAGIAGFRTPAAARARRFCDALLTRGVASTIRWSKGRDVGAACGQLATASSR